MPGPALATFSSLQQLSTSFGLAVGSLVTGRYLSGLPQTDQALVTDAVHHGFLTLAGLTMLSSLAFRRLRPHDGVSVSRGPTTPVAEASPGLGTG